MSASPNLPRTRATFKTAKKEKSCTPTALCSKSNAAAPPAGLKRESHPLKRKKKIKGRSQQADYKKGPETPKASQAEDVHCATSWCSERTVLSRKKRRPESNTCPGWPFATTVLLHPAVVSVNSGECPHPFVACLAPTCFMTSTAASREAQ